jgi:hypothetical protein
MEAVIYTVLCGTFAIGVLVGFGCYLMTQDRKKAEAMSAKLANTTPIPLQSYHPRRRR